MIAKLHVDRDRKDPRAVVHSADHRQTIRCDLTAVDLIGHPTGRLLGHRDGYDFDLDKVLTEAAETGTAMEINASPERLDLNDVMAQRAKNLGVPLAINSDAHQPEGYAYMRYGVATARRAWLTAGDVLNTMAPDALNDWLEHPKPRRWVPHR